MTNQIPDSTIKSKPMKAQEEIKPAGEGARSERQGPRTGRTWMLSSPMVNAMIATKGLGTLPIYGIDVPTVGDSDMTHYGGVVVFGNQERAEQIVREHNSYDALREAATESLRYIQLDPVLDDDGIVVIKQLRAALSLVDRPTTEEGNNE